MRFIKSNLNDNFVFQVNQLSAKLAPRARVRSAVQFAQRHLALADRIRYYWPHPDAQASVSALLAALESRDLSRALVEQFFPTPTINRAELGGALDAATLIAANVEQSLKPYFFTTEHRATPTQERSE